MELSVEEFLQTHLVKVSSKEELAAWGWRREVQRRKTEETVKELREEVKVLRRDLLAEREARLSTEKEKKGLSLLDLLTRSGLTKSLSSETGSEVAELVLKALRQAVNSAEEEVETDGSGGTTLRAVPD
jgi:class 3 adenylate cyclase